MKKRAPATRDALMVVQQTGGHVQVTASRTGQPIAKGSAKMASTCAAQLPVPPVIVDCVVCRIATIRSVVQMAVAGTAATVMITSHVLNRESADRRRN